MNLIDIIKFENLVFGFYKKSECPKVSKLGHKVRHLTIDPSMAGESISL